MNGFAHHRVPAFQLALHAILALQVVGMHMRGLHHLGAQQHGQQQGRQPAGVRYDGATFHGREKLRQNSSGVQTIYTPLVQS